MIKSIKKSTLNTKIDGSGVYLRPVTVKDAALIRKWHDEGFMPSIDKPGVFAIMTHG